MKPSIRPEYILYYMLIVTDFLTVHINNSLVNDVNDLKGVSVKWLRFAILFSDDRLCALCSLSQTLF